MYQGLLTLESVVTCTTGLFSHNFIINSLFSFSFYPKHAINAIILHTFSGFANLAYEREITDKGPYENPETHHIVVNGTSEKAKPTDKPGISHNGAIITVNNTKL